MNIISRDPEQYSNVYANLSVKWHILPNSLSDDVGIILFFFSPSRRYLYAWCAQSQIPQKGLKNRIIIKREYSREYFNI